MINVEANADLVARAFMTRRSQFDGAIARGFRRTVNQVARMARKNLSGGGDDPPGSYPVPVRSGTLRRSRGMSIGVRRAQIWYSAKYAPKIHAERPFLHDAVEDVDGNENVRSELLRIL